MNSYRRAIAILCFGVSVAASAADAQTQNGCPTIEVAVVASGPADSARHVPTTSGQSVDLTATPLLRIDDFTTANVTLTERQIVLNVTMTPDAAKRVQQFSAAHVGQRMAFVVNGRVINTPKILDPITGNGILLAPFQRPDADALAAVINGRNSVCRPTPAASNR